MSVVVEAGGPELVNLASNPVPEGGRVGYFLTQDKVRLRYAIWPKPTGGGHRGTICLVQGRTEFIEKYFETIADFRARGFAVATFDWRGQGGSERLIANEGLGYVDRFEDYWCDLKSFHGEILLPDCPGPFYLVGHSMGGLVSLFAGLHDRLMFDRIFLSAPMLALDRQPLSMAGMARACEALNFLGLGQMPVARKTDKALSETRFAGNPLTSDRTRYMRMLDVVAARPELEIGPPTVRWAAAAMGAMAEAGRDHFPSHIRVPVLMLAAARDTVVSTAAIEQLGLRMRTGRHVVIAGARHELFMENDVIRGQVLAAFDAFITEQSA
jgi:lysophospholipase